MLIDCSVPISAQTAKDAAEIEQKALNGHMGTHFDSMRKDFPLSYAERAGVVFDVRSIAETRDIEIGDLPLAYIEAGCFVAFCTGRAASAPYGTPEYAQQHPQLADALIDALLARGVAIIGVDCQGIRRGAEHVPADSRCAEQGTFVVENLCHLEDVLNGQTVARCHMHTYPIHYVGLTGIPCRVVAER